MQSAIYILSTEEFASINRVKAQTVRARLCNTGSYFGVRPLKLLNGRTAWPNVQVSAAKVATTSDSQVAP